ADRGRPRCCEDVARQSRYPRLRGRRPARGIARDAVPLSARGEGRKQPVALIPCGFQLAGGQEYKWVGEESIKCVGQIIQSKPNRSFDLIAQPENATNFRGRARARPQRRRSNLAPMTGA